MNKIKFMRLILIPSSVLILIGVTLMAWMITTEDERNVIDVELDEGITESISFESLTMLPGGFYEYVIQLERGNVRKYDLSLDFNETEDKALKQFARVKIESGETLLYDNLLASAFEDENIVFPVDLKEGINSELVITYYLPLDVGNEAKNAEAVFDLLLTASNE